MKNSVSSQANFPLQRSDTNKYLRGAMPWWYTNWANYRIFKSVEWCKCHGGRFKYAGQEQGVLTDLPTVCQHALLEVLSVEASPIMYCTLGKVAKGTQRALKVKGLPQQLNSSWQKTPEVSRVRVNHWGEPLDHGLHVIVRASSTKTPSPKIFQSTLSRKFIIVV